MAGRRRPPLSLFHLGERGVPPGGTVCSTWGNINHGFLHGYNHGGIHGGTRIHGADIDFALLGLVAAAPARLAMRHGCTGRCEGSVCWP
jgi:hypothetical protein